MFFKSIDKEVEKFRETEGAVLLDVRTPMEYSQGHIPGSINSPLQDIAAAETVIEDKETPIFVYCYSGARSGSAAGFLEKKGYCNVNNIGGIASYTGEVE